MAGLPISSEEWSEKNGGGGGDPAQQSEVREHDRRLPISTVGRIIRKTLPDNFDITEEATDTVEEIADEFIGFVSSAAKHKCLSDKRKIINGDDLLWAISSRGFGDYVDTLEVYLAKYREFDKQHDERDEDGSIEATTPSTPDQNPQAPGQ